MGETPRKKNSWGDLFEFGVFWTITETMSADARASFGG
jgi:hypothetical protein